MLLRKYLQVQWTKGAWLWLGRTTLQTTQSIGYSSAVKAETEPEPDLATLVAEDEEQLAHVEQLIEAKRNKSRMRDHHYNIYHGQRPYAEPKHYNHHSIPTNRRWLARYGYASQVDPAICWMSREELADKKEYEALAYPHTVQEMVETIKKQRQEEQKAIRMREELIEKNLIKMEKWKEDLRIKIEKKTAEANAIKEKKERLVEEVRRHFGFKVNPKDERFKAMLEEREKEQKKAEKLAKRKAKEAQFLLKLQQKSADT